MKVENIFPDKKTLSGAIMILAAVALHAIDMKDAAIEVGGLGLATMGIGIRFAKK